MKIDSVNIGKGLRPVIIAEMAGNHNQSLDRAIKLVEAAASSGVSDANYRELLLKELDKLNISNNSLIISDAESAFNLLCPTGNGLLISIGTGIICLGKNGNKTFKNLSINISSIGSKSFSI